MRIKRIIKYSIIILAVMVFHNALIKTLSNILTLSRENNKVKLIETTYELRLKNLEESLQKYEEGLNDLSIYEGGSYVLGKIALRDMYGFFDTLTISTDSVVKKDSAVVNEDGLVGIVKDAGLKEAKVSLLTGKTPVSVKIGESYGLVESYDKKENLLKIKNISNYSKIDSGDTAYTSGLQKLEAGIKVGEVASTEIVGVERIVYIKPSVDFSNLNYLMVIDK